VGDVEGMGVAVKMHQLSCGLNESSSKNKTDQHIDPFFNT
jgi:hypothetical protein